MVKSDLVYQESFFYFSKISNHPLPTCFDTQPYPPNPLTPAYLILPNVPNPPFIRTPKFIQDSRVLK